MKELIEIQSELVVPKKHWNDHGKYFYRNNEDILEALKPLCKTHNCLLTMTDDVILLGSRFYIKSTATIKNSAGETESATSSAREPETNNAKMDASQITGSASTYARKCALGGLFCIDDNKDADSENGSTSEVKFMTESQIKTLNSYAKDYQNVDNKKHSFIIDTIADKEITEVEAQKVISRIKASKA